MVPGRVLLALAVALAAATVVLADLPAPSAPLGAADALLGATAGDVPAPAMASPVPSSPDSTTTTVATTATTTEKKEKTTKPTPPPPTVTPTTVPATGNATTTAAPPPPAPRPSEVGELSKAFLAGGFIPFTVVVVLSFIFALGYIRYYSHQTERECGPTTVAVLALTVVLLTGAIVPVDVFLASTLKEHDGTYKHWATLAVRENVKHIVTYAYYAMYGLTELFVFLLLPLAYFFFEEKDEEAGTSTCRRFLNACKYTIGFVVVFGVLMCIGAFALGSSGNACLDTNSTSAKDWVQCRAVVAEHALTSNGGANALSFTIGALTVLGFLYVIFYTAYGMAALPIEMIRSRGKGNREDKQLAKTQLRVNREEQDSIRNKYGDKRRQMSSRDRDRLNRHKETERMLERASERFDAIESSCCGKIGTVLRPFEFVFGVVLFLLGIFLVVALLMTSVDKLLQITTQHLNFKTGYSHVVPHVINPVDKLFTLMQKAFPLDYIFLTMLVYYFIMCTMSGVRALDVRFCFLKMFKIRAHRTAPQGLLFMCLILMFSILTLNVLLLTLMPTYVAYGNQRFSNLDLPADNATCVASKNPYTDLATCTYQAPQYQYFVQYQPAAAAAAVTVQVNARGIEKLFDPATQNCVAGAVFHFCSNTLSLPAQLTAAQVNCSRVEEPCTQTRLAALLNAFFYNAWFFGAIYYWANYGIIAVFALALVWLTCRRRKSLMQSLLNDVHEDFDDDDDDALIPFNPKWAQK